VFLFCYGGMTTNGCCVACESRRISGKIRRTQTSLVPFVVVVAVVVVDVVVVGVCVCSPQLINIPRPTGQLYFYNMGGRLATF